MFSARRGGLVSGVLLAVIAGVWCRGNAAAVDPLRPPDPEASIRTFNAVRAWLDAAATGDEAAEPAAPEGAEVVSVTLRYRGAVVGRSAGTMPLAEAARSAWDDASALVPPRHDALDERRRREFARDLTLELELSGALVPLDEQDFVVLPGAGLGRPRPAINPGLDGLAARLGGSVAVVTPADAIRRGLSPRQALDEVTTAATDDPAAAIAPLEDQFARGMAFLRFRTAHLVQPAPGAGPEFLHRGGRIVEASALQATGAIESLASRIARHLMARRWPGVEPLGIRGDYDPVADEFGPVIASPLEQALAAAALLRYGRTLGDPEANDTGIELLTELAAVIEGEPDGPWNDPASAAATLWALSLAEALTREADALIVMAERCRLTLGEAFTTDDDFAGRVPPAARGLVALGIVSDPALADLAEPAVRAAMRSVEPLRLVTLMPYVLYAERRLAGEGGTIASAVALDEMRRQILDFQMRPADADPDDRDLVGGIVLTVGPSPLPTGQSLRPIAAAAAMLSDERLTPRGGVAFAARVVWQLEMTRFVDQLEAGDAEAFMYPRPSRARGGVRRALWDQSMPVEASVLALLAVVDTLEAVRVD